MVSLAKKWTGHIRWRGKQKCEHNRSINLSNGPIYMSPSHRSYLQNALGLDSQALIWIVVSNQVFLLSSLVLKREIGDV